LPDFVRQFLVLSFLAFGKGRDGSFELANLGVEYICFVAAEQGLGT